MLLCSLRKNSMQLSSLLSVAVDVAILVRIRLTELGNTGSARHAHVVALERGEGVETGRLEDGEVVEDVEHGVVGVADLRQSTMHDAVLTKKGMYK